MKYLSLCSGIEAASVAWHPLGWEAVAFAEIEDFPSQVLAHHYPTVPNLGDMTQIIKNDRLTTRPDVLIGGTPCQSFSIAGKRGGLDDSRGKLMLTYVEIAAYYRPKWILWENVPGCLSSGGGQDFATLLGSITGRKISIPKEGWGNSGTIEGIDSAYGIAWRVLDAQHFGVAQRRRRVFIVGYLGDWRRAAAVLFEQESMCGNPPPSRSKSEDIASTLSACSFTGGAGGKPEGAAGNHFIIDRASFNQGKNALYEPKISQSQTMETMVSSGPHAVAVSNAKSPCAECGYEFDHDYLGKYGCPNCEGEGLEGTMCMAHGQAGAEIKEELSPTLTCNHEAPIAFQQNSRDEVRLIGGDGNIAGALMASPGMKQQNYIVHGTQDPIVSEDIAHCLGTNQGQENALAFEPGILKREGGNSRVSEEVTSTLRAKMGDNQIATAYRIQGHIIDRSEKNGGNGTGYSEEIAGTQTTGDKHAVCTPDMVIRRLTPVECERLQGFPDNYTLIPGKHRPLRAEHLPEAIEYLKGHRLSQEQAEQLAHHPDGHRYHALGNSMAVPVIKWLGERIQLVENLIK